MDSIVTAEAGAFVLFLPVGDIMLVCLLVIITSFHSLLLHNVVDEGAKGFKMKR